METSMEKIKRALKCVGVAAGYLLLLEGSKLIEFWIFAAKVSYEDIVNWSWDWNAMPGSFFFVFPMGMGIFRLLFITVFLCLLVHGKDFRIRREKSILQVLRMHGRTFLTQGVVLAGVVLGVTYTGLPDRLGMLFPYTYFYFTGTHALLGRMSLMDLENPLLGLWSAFIAITDLWDEELFLMLVAYVVYELLRVCFDRKLQQ